MMKCNFDIKPSIAPVRSPPYPMSEKISLVKAFAIQFVFNTKSNQKDSSFFYSRNRSN